MKESEGDWERAPGETKGNIMRERTGETNEKECRGGWTRE